MKKAEISSAVKNELPFCPAGDQPQGSSTNLFKEASGQIAGVAADSSILLIPPGCIPPGVGHVEVCPPSRISAAQRNSRRRRIFVLHFWSQCRVALVVAIAAGLPMMLADYNDLPPLPTGASLWPAAPAVRQDRAAFRTFQAGSSTEAGTAEQVNGNWLGWPIWGSCSKPQKKFDPGSEDTIEAFGNFSPQYKLARDKDQLLDCVTGAFSSRCRADSGYAVDAAGRVETAATNIVHG